jgi:CRISPR-associated protein Cst1
LIKMIDWTGHAVRDVGLATLLVYCQRAAPNELTEADLQAAADWLRDTYVPEGVLRGHLKGFYLLNEKYSAGNPELREPFVARVLYGWQQPHTLSTPCVFCGQPALYRATREEMPLVTGSGVINFSPQGQPGLPVCGVCSLCVQAALLGCYKSGGGLLLIYSDHLPLQLSIVRDALRQAMQAKSLQTSKEWQALPYPKTRFVEQWIHWLRQTERRVSGPARPLQGMHFSNTGQAPFVRLFQIDASVVSWVSSLMHHPDGAVAAAFQRLMAEAPNNDRQPLYEDLLELPHNAERFLRRHLLSASLLRRSQDPRAQSIIVLSFLEKIMGMTSETVHLLRTLGERFAQHQRSKRSFFYEFNRAKTFAQFRRVIIRAVDDHQRRTGQLLITGDEFVKAFLPVDNEFTDWTLSRDLITLYLLEANAASADLIDEDTLATLYDEDSEVEDQNA